MTSTASTPRPALRRRQREALHWAGALGAAIALFLLWPGLDLIVSGSVYGSADGPRFPYGAWAPVQWAYRLIPVTGVSLTVFGLLAGLCPARWCHRPWQLRWRRRAYGLALVLVFGSGLAVNAGLKEIWGRPRPVHVVEFGGSQPFRQINQPSALCQTNCSFVSGHAAAGFALMGLGLAAAPAARRRWWRVGMGAGALFGLGRVLQGGHFTSDIVFAGLVIWGVSLLLQQAWARWRLMRRQRSRLTAPGS